MAAPEPPVVKIVALVSVLNAFINVGISAIPSAKPSVPTSLNSAYHFPLFGIPIDVIEFG